MEARMKRVLKQMRFKYLILFLFILGAAQSSLATTVVVPADDDLIIGARAIVRGKVVAIESSFDESHSRIYTYITIKVKEVLKGEVTERRIVLKEMGGQVGNQGFTIFGNPQFTRGEKVLLYLDTWKDGSLRTHQLFLGKFSIIKDKATGQQFVVRTVPDENTTVLRASDFGGQPSGTSTDRMELSRYIEMVRERLEINRERSDSFLNEHYRGVPLLAQPGEYGGIKSRGGFQSQWTFIRSAHPRWFEPDSGQAVTFVVNPDGAPNPQIMDDIAAAMNAWSTVPGCSLRIATGGTSTACREGFGLNLILFNNCDGRWGATSGCASTLAYGGLSWTGTSKTIGGVTYQQATAGFISFNPYASCYFGNHCNVQEITTHELGHTMGLGHSADSTATMYAFAHFDGRCAGLRADDIAGITSIYQGAGGGPGPLTISTASLPAGTVGTSYSQTLIATGGSQPYTWSLVAGQGNLPTGLSLNASTGAITGTPSATGTFNFTVRVTDSASTTAQKALSIVISQSGTPYNSQFVSQTVPTSVAPGQSFTVNMKFTNTGTQTWSAPGFYLVSQNPALNTTWLGGSYNAVDLGQFIINPGQQLDFNFTATAPTTPGTYNFQWQLYKDNGTGFFGQMTANVAIQVASAPPPATNNAAFVSQSVPSSLNTGQTVSVSVTMQNNGTTTWAAGSYYLGSQNPAANSTWGLNRINLASPVAPGSNATFTFNITAPSTPGTYNFQWQMAQDGSGSFGVASTNIAIAVGSATADTDGDCMPNGVELQEGRNPSVKDNDIFTNARWFAMQQYRDFLGREGESSGITYWTNQITSNLQSRAQVIDNFFRSAEFQATTPITRLYFAYFLRIPDYPGLIYWVTQYRNGTSLNQISQQFAQSQEFTQRYGSLSNDQFVALVYQNVLGRTPDQAGFDYWVNQLNSGAQTRGQVMAGFSESDEYKARSGNWVYVVQMYVGMLRRSPEQAGFDYWVNQMNQGTSGLQLIQGFLDSLEYHKRFLP